MSVIHAHVKAVMAETGKDDPVAAVRAKARALIREFHQQFDAVPPFNLDALASYRGLVVSAEPPKHSPDSEIAPEGGRVVLRVNKSRPLVRQRFSIAHEVGHTLFPDFHLAVRCRKPAGKDLADPSDQLEALCDVAASEILFPSPWFDDALASMPMSAVSIRDLANNFAASPDATIRRLVEISTVPLAAVFCSWKLKPTEMRRAAADRYQSGMFDNRLPTPVPKLRVDYSIINDAFRAKCCNHIPKDKSVPWEGAIKDAAVTQEPSDGIVWLNLGALVGTFGTHVLPIYTAEDRIGPDGAVSVVLLVRPT